MKDYRVSFYLGNMFHTYIVTAPNECEAMIKCLTSIPEGSRECFKDFKIKRYIEPWN